MSGAYAAEIEKLAAAVAKSDNIVFLGGAGVSTESGIPDFRSSSGVYSQEWKYPPETIVSHSFFWQNMSEFYRFYTQKMIFTDAKPNAAHIALAELERRGKLRAVITQNIDGLHQAAGSKAVLELHGSVLRNFCVDCHKFYDVRHILAANGVPRCSCGGVVKPDVVLYEEGLDPGVLGSAADFISKADLMIIGGTSLAVYPAAGLSRYFKGSALALINKSETPLDRAADIVIRENIGEVLAKVATLS